MIVHDYYAQIPREDIDHLVAAAKGLAMTALDLVAHPGELRKAQEEFAKTQG